jgi:hypothetical protein
MKKIPPCSMALLYKNPENILYKLAEFPTYLSNLITTLKGIQNRKNQNTSSSTCTSEDLSASVSRELSSLQLE